MTTFATGNPVPSTAVKDLSDNAENLDIAVNSRTAQNWVDRVGKLRWTYYGMETQFNLFMANSNFEPSVAYVAGLSMTRTTQTIAYLGQIYRPRSDSIPFVTTTWATDAAKFTLVGDSSLRTDLAASTGATLVKNGNRSVAAQINDTTRLEDQLPAGNGSGDDLGPVNAAIAGSSDGIVVTEDKFYRVSGRPSALNGVRYQGRGAIVQDTPLGPRQLNTYGDDLRIHRGREYLDRVFVRFTQKGQVKIVLKGDSTMAGGNGEPFEYQPVPWLSQAFADKGYSNVLIDNQAVGGTRIQDFDPLNALSPTLDLMMIGFGTNNAEPTQAAVDTFLSLYDSKIAQIRNNPLGTFQNLSIMIVGPNATNDIPNGRDYRFYEKIHWGLVELSKKHQCAYYNRYGEFPDADNMAGTFLDASPLVASGVGIHLMPPGISVVWGGLIEWAFPDASMTIFKTNAFSNNGSASGIPLAATPGTSYRQGRHIFRVNPTAGWPDDGMVDVLVNPDGPIVQRLTTFGVRHKEYTRSWVIAGGIWTAWTGVAFPLVLGNSWNNFGSGLPPATVTLLADGIHAYVTFAITGGVTTVGAAFAQIPSQLAPAYVDLFDAKITGGGSCEIRMLTDGTLQFETAGNATLTKGSFTYRVAT